MWKVFKFPIFCSYFQNIAFGINIFIILEMYFQSKFSELELLCERENVSLLDALKSSL